MVAPRQGPQRRTFLFHRIPATPYGSLVQWRPIAQCPNSAAALDTPPSRKSKAAAGADHYARSAASEQTAHRSVAAASTTSRVVAFAEAATGHPIRGSGRRMPSSLINFDSVMDAACVRLRNGQTPAPSMTSLRAQVQDRHRPPRDHAGWSRFELRCAQAGMVRRASGYRNPQSIQAPRPGPPLDAIQRRLGLRILDVVVQRRATEARTGHERVRALHRGAATRMRLDDVRRLPARA